LALWQCFPNCVSPENFSVSQKINLVLIWDKKKVHSLH
jgi:hypothetical protein